MDIAKKITDEIEHLRLASETKYLNSKDALMIIDQYMIKHEKEFSHIEIVAFNKARILLEKEMEKENV